jgi:hypothetical protein
MKPVLLQVLLLLLTPLAWSAPMAAQLGLGMDRGAPNIAIDLDYMAKPRQSVGAYFLLASDKEGVRNQFWSMGADIKVYFGPKQWRLYLAPGFGVASFELPNNNAETAFGALMKVGTLHQISKSLFF